MRRRREANRAVASRRIGWAVALLAAGAVALGPSALAATTPVTPGTVTQVTALVKASVKITAVTPTVAAELPGAPVDIADFVYDIPAVCVTATACVYGDTTAAKTIVLFGNSHARMWLPAIIPLATTDGYKIVLLGKNECPVVSINFPNSAAYPQCNTVIPTSLRVINQIKPALVILADRTVEPKYTAAKWKAGMEKTIATLKPSKATIVVMGDIQEFSFNPISCLTRNPTAVQSACSMANPNPKVKGYESAEQAAAKADKATYLTPTKWLCTTTRCSPIIGSFLAYWDQDHVSVTYASYLSTVMGDALQPLITARGR